MDRNTVRSAIFSQKRATKLVTLDDGTEIEVRQISVGDLLDSLDRKTMRERITKMLMDSCFVPGTDDKVFEEADYDTLLEMPSGGVYQKLIDACNSFTLGPQLEEARKNSTEETDSTS